MTLFLDGNKVGEGRVNATQPMMFSGDETTDLGSPVKRPQPSANSHRRYGAKDSGFTGKVKWVEIDLGADAEDADHLITAEDLYRVAMVRQ